MLRPRRRPALGVALVLASLAAVGCGRSGDDPVPEVAAKAEVAPQASVASAAPASNHAFTRVTECVRDYAETDWCDAAHVRAIEAALHSRRADFAGHHVLLVVPDATSPERVAIAAIDTRTGVVRPLPVDSIGGNVDDRGFDLPGSRPRIDYRPDGNQVCVSGSLYEYRNTYTNSTACFELGDAGFTAVR